MYPDFIFMKTLDTEGEAYRENNELQYCSLAEAKGKGEGEGKGKADSDCIVLCAVVLLNLSGEASHQHYCIEFVYEQYPPHLTHTNIGAQQKHGRGQTSKL